MLRQLWWILGLLLVVGGLAIALSSHAGPADFGWFAYTPLDDSADWQMNWGGSAVLVSRWQIAGWVMTAIGLMVVAAVVGFRLGRTRSDSLG